MCIPMHVTLYAKMAWLQRPRSPQYCALAACGGFKAWHLCLTIDQVRTLKAASLACVSAACKAHIAGHSRLSSSNAHPNRSRIPDDTLQHAGAGPSESEGQHSLALTSVPQEEAHEAALEEQAQPQAQAHGHMPDAGLVMGRSCRVGWGPGGLFAHAGAAPRLFGQYMFDRMTCLMISRVISAW